MRQCTEEHAVSLEHLVDIVTENNRRWWKNIDTGEPLKRNVGEILMLVTSELAEALEGDRKGLMDDKLPNRKMFDVEIIDALIRLFDIVGHLVPDAGDIFVEKMNYNLHREDHTEEYRKLEHGKRY